MERKNFMGKISGMRLVALVLLVALAIGGVVGGTVAWLIDSPDPVVNTFTYGDINIDLEETDTTLDDDENPNTNDYKMLPGQPIKKDPIVTVKAGSEDMWLFVKLEKSINFDTFMDYEVDSSWVELAGVDGVYYRYITADEIKTKDLVAHVIADDTVTVKESVTKEMLNMLDKNVDGTDAPPESVTYPTLRVTAYAVQAAGNADAATAWGRVTAQETP